MSAQQKLSVPLNPLTIRELMKFNRYVEGQFIFFLSSLDQDECQEPDRYPCPANSHCVNTVGNYTCKCDAGFTDSGGLCQGKAKSGAHTLNGDFFGEPQRPKWLMSASVTGLSGAINRPETLLCGFVLPPAPRLLVRLSTV